MEKEPKSIKIVEAVSLAASGKREEALQLLNDLQAPTSIINLTRHLYRPQTHHAGSKDSCFKENQEIFTQEQSTPESATANDIDWVSLLRQKKLNKFHNSAASILLTSRKNGSFEAINSSSIREELLLILTPPTHSYQDTTLSSALEFIDGRMTSGLLRSAGIGYMAIHLLWPNEHAWPLYNWKRAIDVTHPTVASLVHFIGHPDSQ